MCYAHDDARLVIRARRDQLRACRLGHLALARGNGPVQGATNKGIGDLVHRCLGQPSHAQLRTGGLHGRPWRGRGHVQGDGSRRHQVPHSREPRQRDMRQVWPQLPAEVHVQLQALAQAPCHAPLPRSFVQLVNLYEEVGPTRGRGLVAGRAVARDRDLAAGVKRRAADAPLHAVHKRVRQQAIVSIRFLYTGGARRLDLLRDVNGGNYGHDVQVAVKGLQHGLWLLMRHPVHLLEKLLVHEGCRKRTANVTREARGLLARNGAADDQRAVAHLAAGPGPSGEASQGHARLPRGI
mmetsp:Transcript_31236/g.89554  ORF Transcript_31236/g.89554 Transcript_31236/m.89554 type:complete len:295 (+) Transcript_31236:2301-3185(+)